MRKLALLVAMFGLWGCARPAQKATPIAPTESVPRPTESVKDVALSAPASEGTVDLREGETFELAVQLAPADDYASELAALDDAEPERFAFNSVLGAGDGVALGDVPDGESVDAAVARLKLDPRVSIVEPLVTVHAAKVPNDPQYKLQWNLQKIHMEQAWDVAQGEGVVVAVIDTGIAYEDHGDFRQVPDLKGARFAPGYDFVNDTTHPDDDNGHGTHVAGTIAQATDNREGVAGVAYGATLMPIKVLDADGSGNSADIADAIRWATQHGAKVINMSLGGGAPSQIMADAVAYARKHGTVVVCAAGNGGRGVVEYPAAYPGAVAVSAIRFDGQLAPYSSWGKELDIAAPGGDKSVDQNGDGQPDGILQNTIDPSDPSKSIYAWFQGTSMAAPHVAGAAALLFSAGAKNPDQVEQALFAGAGASGTAWNDRTGHGILDVAASLQALKKGTRVAVAPESSAAFAGNGEASSVKALAQVGPKRASTAASIFKIVLGILLAVGVTATLRKRQRNPLGPALLIALTLSAAGLFFLPAPGAGTAGASALGLIELPLPDWGRWLFGPGRASPIFYSALIPLVLSFVGYAWKGSRQVMGGVCFGFAAFMSYAVWSGAPAIAWMPVRLVAIPWLLANILLCLFLARALVRKTEV